MSKQSFTDADGDYYGVSSAGGRNIVLTYRNPEVGGVDMFIFKIEHAQQIAEMIIDVAKEAAK